MSTRRDSDPDPEATAILQRGKPAEVRALLASGFDVTSFRHRAQYDALMTSVFGRDVFADTNLVEALQLLIKAGAPLSGKSSYGESALSVLSHMGRFDAVRVLLEAGADESLLHWTPLARAVALGGLEDVREMLKSVDQLEVQDRWWRTPFLLALARGSTEIAEMLVDAGANHNAKDHVGRTALFHAVGARRLEPVRWLLARGVAADSTDGSGGSPLAEAVEADDWPMVDLLLSAGADPNHPQVGFSALASARSLRVATRLLEAGADPRELRYCVQRLFTCRTEADEANAFVGLAAAEVAQDRTRRFGIRNPDLMNVPFWNAMVRSGVSGYVAAKHFGLDALDPERPVWCADRFGQSMTILADGRIVQIGGEHEDGYDPDFCIYNDVIVHHPDGRFDIYGYPKHDFPPTDFHTATLVGDRIVIIGSVGYPGERLYGTTPVHVLDIATWQIKPLATRGEMPGWIGGHLATLESGDRIVINQGKILHQVEGAERYDENAGTFVLHLDSAMWHRLR
jgi:ankyrin repeat protein